jgi:hypothetical protein
METEGSFPCEIWGSHGGEILKSRSSGLWRHNPEDLDFISSPCSQEPATVPYPEPDESRSCFPKIESNINLPSTPRSSVWPLSEYFA